MSSMTVAQLADACAGPTPPLVIDVRRREAFLKDSKTIGGALRRDPERVDAWAGELPSAEKVVVSCVHGHEVSQGVARALKAGGRDAYFLDAGFADWQAAGRHVMPSRRLQALAESHPSGPRSIASPAGG